MNLPMLMADSTTPSAIPAHFADFGAAAAYRDGFWKWADAQLRRFPRRIGICVTGDPAAAAHARVVDVERFDADPAHAHAFIAARIRLGHTDGTVYASRSVLPAILHALGGLPARLWIATLDARPWTPAELAADILANQHITIDPERIWAVQYLPAGPGRSYDTSIIYGQPPASR